MVVDRSLLFFVASLCGAMPSLVLACEGELFPSNQKSSLEKPIELRPDCSFEDRRPLIYSSDSEYIGAASLLGGPAIDRGNGIVAQRITDAVACLTVEKLLVVDCTSSEAIMIDGVEPPNFEGIGWSERRIKYIQPPYGPIAVTKESTVSGLAKMASDSELLATTEIDGFFAQVRRRDRYESTCGCTVFYPDSAAARK